MEGQLVSCNSRGVEPLFFVRFVGRNVELAMKALSQVENDHAIYVKIVSATGAGGYCRQEDGNNKKHQPDPEHDAHGPVRGGNGVGYPQGRHIDEDGSEEISPSLSDQAERRSKGRWIGWLRFGHGLEQRVMVT